ncbi:cytochrome P450 [Methylomicrobium sp. Wu6]|uniref:cytochrome P450 n=1 Tax=Methylomicrobium sp. Wu6 TaxID=3107928 RepID=UPI002DD6A2F2|nr:cytochrome P450 [Methylomicrobium sp. Wu6]
MQHSPIPTPRGRPVIGHLAEFKKNSLDCMIRWHHEWGDIVNFRIFSQNFYLLSHPDLVEEAMTEQQDVFLKMYNPQKPRGLQLFMGQGLVTSTGQLWSQQRRLLQPVFQRRNLLTLLPEMEKAGAQLLARWRTFEPDAKVDISGEMLHLALEVLTRTMFSTSVLDRVDVIAPALEVCLRYAAATVLSPLDPPLWVPTRRNREFKRALATLDQIIYGMIDERKANPGQYNDLLHLLLSSTDPEAGTGMSRRQLRDEVITLFVAGHETSANVLTWTLYYLARYPEAMTKLRAELREVLNGGIPNGDQLDQLPYTKAVLFEAMRLKPAVALMIRKVARDTRLQNYSLKAGSLAMVSIYNIHHHPELWENPEAFKPERFLGQKASKYTFLPFGIGPRFCIGNQFATMELTLLLAMLAQHFDFALCDEQEPEHDMAVTLRPKGGLKLRVRPATSVL